MRESQIEEALCAAVKARGGHAYKFTSPGRRAVPDRLVLLPGGVLVFVELKATGAKPSAMQLREHDRIRALGFEVLVIDSLEGVAERFTRRV